jgi:putative NADH-flavin reductase
MAGLRGATGIVGSAPKGEALHRGHDVTAIVRHPEKLEKRDGLTATAGDIPMQIFLHHSSLAMTRPIRVENGPST